MTDSALMAFGGAVFFLVLAASYVYLRSSIASAERLEESVRRARPRTASQQG